jgi:rhodanese-related sulfurtransferase
MERSGLMVGWLGVVLACSLGLGGCDAASKVSDKDLRYVTFEQLSEILATKEVGKKPTLLIDVRSPSQFSQGHIPGAIHMTLPEMVRGNKTLNQAERIVVYANTWTDDLAPAAGKRLLSLGFTNVDVYRGGYVEWKSHNSGAAGVGSGSPAAGPVN